MNLIKNFLVLLALVQTAAAAALTNGYTIGSGLLGSSVIIDNAATGGGDSSSSTGNLGWTAELAGLWNSNSIVSISGISLPIFSDANTANTTVSGTFTFYFYDLDSGTNANSFDGTGVETLLGTATASFTQGAVGAYYAAFNSPVQFTAKSSGVAVRIINTGWLRLKIVPAATAPGVVLKSSLNGTNIGGANPNFRMSLAGTVFSPSIFPPRVNLAKFQMASVSTTNGQYLPDFVNDGLVNNNSWRTLNVNTPHWAEIDFPVAVTIASAHVFSGIDDGSALASFKIQYQSGTNWLDAPGSARSGNTSVETNVIFSSTVTAAAFRLYSDDNGNQRVKEIALVPPHPNTNGVEQGYPIGTDVEINLAKKRSAFATSISGTNFPKLAVDGFVDSSSKWQTTLVGSNSLMVDLRIPAKIGSAHLYSGDGAVPPITNFVLQYWDGSAWQAIPGGAVSGNTNAACVITFASSVTTSNVLLIFTNSSVSAVRELCIFPANGGVGYPLGEDVVSAAPPTLKWDDYNDAFYNVINRAANLPVTVSGGPPSLGSTNLADPLNQYQVLLNIGTDTYRLRHRVTGQCLAGAGISTNAGALLVDQDYTAMPHQNWRLGKINGTDFYLINQWSGLVVDTAGGSITNGTALVQNSASSANSQRWRFTFLTHYPKKGLAGLYPNWAQFKGNWAYNWGRSTTEILPDQMVFNPMQWGNFNWDIGSSAGPVERYLSEWHREDKSIHYLGFNEPDQVGQANITVDKAISLWPRLERMDLPLAGPAAASSLGDWATNFWSQADDLGYRIDAAPSHDYGNPGSGSSDGIFTRLQSVYNNYGRPVWLTEFSTVDWNNNSSWTEEDNYNWLAEFMWRAESVTWLRHYSLFLFTADTNYPTTTNPWDAVGQRSNAFQTNGTPTSFGELYFAWDCDANVRADTAYFLHNRSDRKRIRNAISSTAPSVGTIRESTNTTQWVLRPSDVAGQYYIVSLRDGRRLRCTNGVVNFAPAQTTGPTVRWNWIEYQYGWFYLENPASPAGSRRLKDTAGTFSMVTNNTATDQVRWRFVVPYAPVETTAPNAPANLIATAGTNQVSLTWTASGAVDFSFYSVYRTTNSGGGYSLIDSNLASATYLDSGVVVGTNYFYVVTATDSVGYESSFSSEANATAVPPWPTTPTNLNYAVSNQNLILNWPLNYTGWLLQNQTNNLGAGLGTNWFTVTNSGLTNQMTFPINRANPSVYFRLMRPE